MGLTKRLDTPEAREYWEEARRCTRIVKSWPKWKREAGRRYLFPDRSK